MTTNIPDLEALLRFEWDKQQNKLSVDGFLPLEDLLPRDDVERVFAEIVLETNASLVSENVMYEIQPTRFVLTALRSFLLNSEDVKRRIVEEEEELTLTPYDLEADLDISSEVTERTIQQQIGLEAELVDAIENEEWPQADKLLRIMLAIRGSFAEEEKRLEYFREAHLFGLEIAALAGDTDSFVLRLETLHSIGAVDATFIAPHAMNLLSSVGGFGVEVSVSLLGKLRLRQLRRDQGSYLDEQAETFLARFSDAFTAAVASARHLAARQLRPLARSVFRKERTKFLRDTPWVENVKARSS